jgi:hypothetical protein
MLHDKTFEFSPFYLFEFHAKFDDGIEVNVHLNPREKAFRNLCNCAIKSKMLSLHFYNLDSVITISICVELDEEIEWFERNLEISKKIRSNSLFKSLSDYAIKQNSNDKNFYFFQNKKIKFAGF